MVAFTPNRGYPYSQPADPFDVPGAIQALAEAIDVDMQLLSDSIVQRPFAAVSSRSATSQVFPPDTVTEATFDFVDADTASISNLPTRPTRLTPTSPGFWCVWGAIAVPLAQSELKDVFLRVNGGDLVRNGFHINNPVGTPDNMITLAGMAFMDGIDDYFTMTFNPVNGLENFKIRNKQMACFRLTEA